jgi:hypothetical protein
MSLLSKVFRALSPCCSLQEALVEKEGMVGYGDQKGVVINLVIVKG